MGKDNDEADMLLVCKFLRTFGLYIDDHNERRDENNDQNTDSGNNSDEDEPKSDMGTVIDKAIREGLPTYVGQTINVFPKKKNYYLL